MKAGLTASGSQISIRQKLFAAALFDQARSIEAATQRRAVDSRTLGRWTHKCPTPEANKRLDAATAQTGKTAWLLFSKGQNASEQGELRKITEEIQQLQITQAEQNVDMERRQSLLPRTALLAFGSVIGKSTTKDQVALLLSEAEKQKVVLEITKLCKGQCVFKAGVEYPYAAVGLILENLQKPFALNGTPFQD